MKQASKWILVVAAFGLACCVSAQEIDPATVELSDQVDRLFLSVIDDDVAGIDEATCLADLLHAQLAREEALRLITDAADPVLVAERTSAVRQAVIAFVERLLEEGHDIAAVDSTRVEPVVAGSGEGETLVSVGGEELEITAAGVLAIRMVSLPQPVDLSVYRLGTRWCLDPLSMQ